MARGHLGSEIPSDGSFHVGKRTVKTRFIFSTFVGLNPTSQMMLLVISKRVLTGFSKAICAAEELRSPVKEILDVNFQSEKMVWLQDLLTEHICHRI